MTIRRLFDRERSGNCYRVRLMLALLGVDCERVPVDTGGGASILFGAHAAPPGDDRPEARVAEVTQWLILPQNELLSGLA